MRLGGLSSIRQQKNTNPLHETSLVSKCLICQQHTNLIAIMTEPITISQKTNDNNPSPERTRAIMELRSRKIRSRPLLPSLSSLATASLQLLKRGDGCLEGRQQLPPCFKHQQRGDGYPVLLHPFRTDFFGAKY